MLLIPVCLLVYPAQLVAKLTLTSPPVQNAQLVPLKLIPLVLFALQEKSLLAMLHNVLLVLVKHSPQQLIQATVFLVLLVTLLIQIS